MWPKHPQHCTKNGEFTCPRTDLAETAALFLSSAPHLGGVSRVDVGVLSQMLFDGFAGLALCEAARGQGAFT